MKATLSETERRREIQIAYNERNGIVPATIKKGVSDILIAAEAKGLYRTDRKAAREAPRDPEELQTSSRTCRPRCSSLPRSSSSSTRRS